MVLSRKKLKQKLRSLLAETVASTESNRDQIDGAAREEMNRQLESVKEKLMGSKSPRPTKRPRKRKKPAQSDGDASEEERRKREEMEKKKAEEMENREKRKLAKRRKREERNKRRREEMEEKKAEEGSENKEINDEKPATELNHSTNYLAESEQNEKKVYVGGIPYYSTEDDIKSFFEGCGTVIDVDCMKFPETGKFRGIAILTFKTEAAAKRALALDGADMGGFYLKIQPYKSSERTIKPKPDFSPQVVEGYNRIYIGNLSWDITEDDLQKLFSDCKVSAIRFGMDKATGEFRGYGHVDFQESGSLAMALGLDQTVVCGRPVRIRCAVPKKEEAEKAKFSVKPESDQRVGNDVINGKEEGGNEEKVVEEEGQTKDEVSGSKKKKRRTCYECGTPGHLSSECPNKKKADG